MLSSLVFLEELTVFFMELSWRTFLSLSLSIKCQLLKKGKWAVRPKVWLVHPLSFAVTRIIHEPYPLLHYHCYERFPEEERILKVTKKSGNRGRCRKLSLWKWTPRNIHEPFTTIFWNPNDISSPPDHWLQHLLSLVILGAFLMIEMILGFIIFFKPIHDSSFITKPWLSFIG